MKYPEYETRNLAELRQHYEVEKRLAGRLMSARLPERQALYSVLYTELLQTVPQHPQHTRKADPAKSDAETTDKLCLLKTFLKPSMTFLEIGAGNCSVSLRVASLVRKVYALEVSEEVMKHVPPIPNLQKIISDGSSVPVPAGGIDLAYSYQVMEHVHPEDAMSQLRNIYRALAPGGKYICVTPDRVSGPHDISQYFDATATGFHLKEYTWGELAQLFRSVGFKSVNAFVGARNRYFKVPLAAVRLLENSLALLPHSLARRFGRLRGFQNLLFITAVAVK